MRPEQGGAIPAAVVVRDENLAGGPASESDRTAAASANDAPAPSAAPAGREEASRRERLGDILHRGDARDIAAERRDRKAEESPGEDVEAYSGLDHSGLDRIWAGRDRDASMIDRADLINELRDRDTPEADPEHQRREALAGGPSASTASQRVLRLRARRARQ